MSWRRCYIIRIHYHNYTSYESWPTFALTFIRPCTIQYGSVYFRLFQFTGIIDYSNLLQQTRPTFSHPSLSAMTTGNLQPTQAIRSHYAQQITGQVTEVQGQAQPELTQSKRQKTGPAMLVMSSKRIAQGEQPWLACQYYTGFMQMWFLEVYQLPSARLPTNKHMVITPWMQWILQIRLATWYCTNQWMGWCGCDVTPVH